MIIHREFISKSQSYLIIEYGSGELPGKQRVDGAFKFLVFNYVSAPGF